MGFFKIIDTVSHIVEILCGIYIAKVIFVGALLSYILTLTFLSSQGVDVTIIGQRMSFTIKILILSMSYLGGVKIGEYIGK